MRTGAATGPETEPLPAAYRITMATRSFRSPDGAAWQVWDVSPGDGPARRSTPHLPQEMRDGWLCFQSGDDKRRLFPVPAAWDAGTDDELWVLCGAAAPVRRPPDGAGDTRALVAELRDG